MSEAELALPNEEDYEQATRQLVKRLEVPVEDFADGEIVLREEDLPEPPLDKIALDSRGVIVHEDELVLAGVRQSTHRVRGSHAGTGFGVPPTAA